MFCTPWGMNNPHLILLVALEHDPRAWFAEPRVAHPDENGWDVYTRWGKFYVLPAPERAAVLAELRARGRPARVLLVLRPDEEAPCPPAAEIRGPNGQIELLLYDCEL